VSPDPGVHADYPRLRVAFVAGGLGQGGAEKQLVYMAGALLDVGATVAVYSLTRGEHYESTLRGLGIPVTWIGRRDHPIARLVALTRELRAFRPDVVHASHFFANLYAALAAPTCGAVGIGSLRNDVVHEVEANGRWGPWLLRLPRGLVANSEAARRRAMAHGVSAGRVRVIPNVIDIRAELNAPRPARGRGTSGVVVLALARLAATKRLDYFLAAVAKARAEMPTLRGVIAGEGPERARLTRQAEALGLVPDGVVFAGHRDDVSAVLAEADMLLLTSDHEGFPNAILEAMAAGLPVVTTPAGDAGEVVEDGSTGYVVPHGAVDVMAARLVSLARAAALRSRLGEAGRMRVEREFAPGALGRRLLTAYAALAREQRRAAIADLLLRAGGAPEGADPGRSGVSYLRGSPETR
jgi:glycosyltransferase involved in cell wall biosynthesis